MIQTTTRICTQAHGTIPTEDYDMKGGRGISFILYLIDMYQITITKTREYTDEEMAAMEKARSPYYRNSEYCQPDTTIQVLSTALDEEQFKAIQKAVIETFK